MNYVYPTGKVRRYRFPTHTNDLVIDRSETASSEVFIVVLDPGEAPPLHQHEDMEQIFYILEGRGRLEIEEPSRGEMHMVGPGDVVHIPPHTPHRIECAGDSMLRYLAVDCFLPERRPGEPTWDDHVRTICREQGWSYRDVVAGNDDVGTTSHT